MVVQTVSGYERIPDFLARSTVGDFKGHLNRIEDEAAPDTYEASYVHGHISFAGRNKYPELLEQNRKLHEKDYWAVQDSRDVDPL